MVRAGRRHSLPLCRVETATASTDGSPEGSRSEGMEIFARLLADSVVARAPSLGVSSHGHG